MGSPDESALVIAYAASYLVGAVVSSTVLVRQLGQGRGSGVRA